MRRRLLALSIAITTIVGSGSVIARQSTITGPGLKRSSAPRLALPAPRTFELSHVRPESFAAALGKDPARIFQFVRDEIAFEPYVGSLRGPRGTLLAMAGNSVDRASLLASMLVAAGQEVRFAHGTLSETLAKSLVMSALSDRGRVAAATPDHSRSDSKAAMDRLKTSMQLNAAMILDALTAARSPINPDPAGSIDRAVRDAQEHYWVQSMRNGVWVDLDPSFDVALAGRSFAEAQETFDALPEALFHRVDLRVRLEEYTGDTASNRQILEYSANAADLSGADMVFGQDFDGNPKQNHFQPFLLLSDQKIAGDPFYVKTPSDAAAVSIVDAFGGGPDPVAIATAEWIEIAFTTPGAGTETVVREIFDRVGMSRRTRGEHLTEAQVNERCAEVNSAYFSAGVYDLFFTTGAIDATHFEGLTVPPSQTDLIDLRAGLREINVASAALSDAALGRTVGNSGAIYRFFLETPRVQIADVTMNAGAVRFSLDLRRDPVAIVTTAAAPAQVFYAHVLQGVADGAIERIVVEQLAGSPVAENGPAATSLSTNAIFESALAAKVPTLVMTRDMVDRATNFPADVRARVREAMAHGNVVVAPQRPIAAGGAPRFAWWQIDPVSGATIAVTDTGLHQDTAEYVVTKRDGEIHFELYLNGKHMPYQAQNFANGPMARQFISGLFKELEQSNITLVITRWTSLM